MESKPLFATPEGYRFPTTEKAVIRLEQRGFGIPYESEARAISDAYVSELLKGFEHQNSSLAMIDSHIPNVDLSLLKRGQRALVINFGGTNIRASVNTIDEHGGSTFGVGEYIQAKITQKKFPNGQAFYEGLLGQVGGFLQEINPESIDGIAIIFSFAGDVDEHDGIVDMRLQPNWMTKGFNVPNMAGSRVAEAMLQTEIMKPFQRVPNVAVMNDMPPVCIGNKLGVILATGLNSGVLIDGRYYVTETAHFTPPMSDYDQIIDDASTNPGKALMEKQTAGGEMGKLFSVILQDLKGEDLIKGNIDRAWISEDVTGFVNNPEYLSDRFIPEDREIMDLVAKTIVHRSAGLIGIAMGSKIRAFPEQFPEDVVKISVEGALLPKINGYAEIATAYAWFATGKRKRVEFVPGEYLDMKGAAQVVLSRN